MKPLPYATLVNRRKDSMEGGEEPQFHSHRRGNRHKQEDLQEETRNENLPPDIAPQSISDSEKLLNPKCKRCEKLQFHLEEISKKNYDESSSCHDRSCCYLLVIAILVVIIAILTAFLWMKGCQKDLVNCENERKTCQMKLEKTEHDHVHEIEHFQQMLNNLNKTATSFIGMESFSQKHCERDYKECKEEKAGCLMEKEELRKDMQQLSKQTTSLNLKYVQCDSERPAHAECKEEKKKCLKETCKLNELVEQLKKDKSALDVKYAKCDTHRDNFEQCKIDKKELEHDNKKLKANLNGLNIEATILNITHSYDSKEMKTCETRLHLTKVNMQEYKEQYIACLKDKDSTSAESQKNDVICKVELAKCEANLRQAIETSSQCQEKLASCRWC